MLEIVKRALKALHEQRSAAHDELNAIAPTIEARGADAVATPAEEARAAELVSSINDLDAKIDEHAARCAELEQIEARSAAASYAVAKAGIQFKATAEPAKPEDVRSMNATQLVDTVRRGAEERGIDPTHAANVLRKHRTDGDWLRNLAARSTDVYATAFAKVMTGGAMFLNPEERAAMAVGTNTSGGLLLPTHLDPTLIITNTGSMNAIRRIARVVTLTNEKAWNGVSAAGVTASWDGELVEVSDDTPAFVAKPVATHVAQAFVQASQAAFDDIDGLAGEVLAMFSDARDRLEGAAHMVGTGSGQPYGIFTVCDANTNCEVTSTTAATIGLVDLQLIRRTVGARWRNNGTFVMAPVYADAVRALGTAVSASYSTDITGGNTDKLLGRPVVESDDCPTTQTTTVRDNEIVYGDFSNFLLVDKPGSSSVKYIDALFNTSNNLPDGRVGWFLQWRHGANSVNDVAFALLQDKTSA